MDDDPFRHDWLTRRLDRDVRATLQAALLWTDSVVEGVEREPAPGVRDRVRTVRRELSQALTLVDELVALGRPEGLDGERLWPRSIVVRDLLGAAVRTLHDEADGTAVSVDVRVRPEDLQLVADPDRTLRAVLELLRAGARSARPGEELDLTAEECDGEGEQLSPFIGIVMRAPRISVGPEGAIEELCRGLPSPTVDSRRWPAALPLGVAGRCAAVLGGDLAVEAEGEGAVRVVLSLPADRRPERRPGWIT